MKENDVLITKFGRAKINKRGYYIITSSKEGNNAKQLHRLIWEDWYGKPVPDGYDIHHINGDRCDNRIQNLQCVEHSLHASFHQQNISEETKQKISKWDKERWKNDEYRKKMSEIIRKYTLWDNSSVRYDKKVMFNKGRTPNPCKCFDCKYNGYRLPIGGFIDFLTPEIINNLVKNTLE